MPRDADLSAHLVTLQDVLGQMDRFGDTPAVLQMVEQNGEARTTFAELSMAAQTFAEHLREHPSTRRKVVGLLAPNSLAWIQAFWGIIGAGLAVMPIDWHASHDDIAHMMEVASCDIILTPGSQVERIQAIHKGLKIIDLDAIASEVAQRPDQVPVLWTPRPPLPRPGDIAVLAFTSGTTGLPKAVPLTHANLLSNINALSHEGFIGENDRVLIPLPLHHIYPLTVGLLTVSSCGAGIVLPSGLSGPELVTALQRYRVTVLLGVPRLYNALADGILRAAAAFAAGASLGNDISGFADPDYLEVAARAGATVVGTHIRLAPRVPDPDPVYDDVVATVRAFLRERAARATAVGLTPDRIVLDAGLDLGKTAAQSLALLRASRTLAGLGFPLLLSASNKTFLGATLGLEIGERTEASLAATALGVSLGCRIVRVHGVGGNRRVCDALAAIARARRDAA